MEQKKKPHATKRDPICFKTISPLPSFHAGLQGSSHSFFLLSDAGRLCHPNINFFCLANNLPSIFFVSSSKMIHIDDLKTNLDKHGTSPSTYLASVLVASSTPAFTIPGPENASSLFLFHHLIHLNSLRVPGPSWPSRPPKSAFQTVLQESEIVIFRSTKSRFFGSPETVKGAFRRSRAG